MTTRATVEEWVREAYASETECPPAELFLADELKRLDAEQLRRLESHVEGCSACAAERDLAAAFEVPADLAADDRRIVEGMARRLAPHRRGGGLLDRLGLASLGSLVRAPAFQFAAAAVLILVVGFAVQTGAPPELGDTPSDRVMRGSALKIVAPIGDLDAVPTELSWEPVEGAAEYRVTVRGVDDEIIAQATTEGNSLPFGSLLSDGAEPAVTYGWTVEALSVDGTLLAGSRAVSFRVLP